MSLRFQRHSLTGSDWQQAVGHFSVSLTCPSIYTEWHRKRWTAMQSEHNFCKLLLNSGFILVECMSEIASGDSKELIFFAMLFLLNILCGVIHDIIDKHVYIWRIWLIVQLVSFGNDRLQLLQRTGEQHFD